MSKPAVAFLGLGVMGAAIAAHLVEPFALTVWNRSPGPAQALRGLGADVASSPAQAVRTADVVLYSLADDAAIEAVVFGPDGILAGLRADQLVIDLSTVHPDTSRREAAAYAARGARFLDAPVFGSRPEAEAAELCIVVGGPPEDYQRALPVFAAIAASSHHMGPTGQGATTGLIGSLVVCLQLQALGEGLVLAQKAGLDPGTVVSVLGLTDFRSPILTGMGAGIVSRDFAPVFSLDHLAKDANQIARLAEQLGVPVPGSAAVRETIKGARAQGWGHQNASALVKSLELQAGAVVGRPASAAAQPPGG